VTSRPVIESAQASHLPTVLIVDDEPTTRQTMRMFLKHCGYAAIEAATVERAVEALSSDISAAVIDVSLAGERSGLEVLSPIRRTPKLSEIPVLVLTGGSLTDAEETLVREQHAHVFYKPESFDTIVSTLDRLTGRVQAVAAAPLAPPDNVARLREEFVAGVQIESALLMTSLDADFDVARARKIFHRWTGLGGTLGFPDLSRRALALQPLLECPLPTVLDRLREGIDTVARTVTSAALPIARKPFPPELVNGLRGKTIALVGLRKSDADWMADALVEAGASARVLNAGDSSPVPRGRDVCDALVIDASIDWNAKGSGLAVLFFGSADAVARWSPAGLDGLHDFLVTPCDREEFLLRVHRLAAHNRPGRARPAAVADRTRVLVADDDPTITALLKAALQNCDFDCHVARDGGEALELVEALLPDALVLDLNMPHFDGFEVLAAVRQSPATAALPVVLLSARQQEVDILRGFSLGADDYVAKPFSPVELVARVKRLVRGRGAA